MKKAILFFCKLAISGVLALVILSGFAFVFYNPPTAEAQTEKYTNSKFTPGIFWSDMTEGFGFGVINNLGYNDPDAYDPTKPVIAVIGSSHTEAFQVPQNKTYTAQLQDLLQAQRGETVNCLNLGVSGHFLNISVSNFGYFADSFENVECAIIEVAELKYTPEEFEKMLAGEYHSDLKPRGTLYSLAQKIPYARLLYKQFQDSQQKSSGIAAEEKPLDYFAYEESLNKVMQQLSDIATENNFPLVILYHCSLDIENLNILRKDDPKMVEIFQKCCEQNNIGFLDMTNSFTGHFNNTYELPYGFSNTTIGEGHLNILGHRLIAEELCNYIAKEEN